MTCIAIVIFRKTPVLRFVVFHGVINVVMMKAGLGIKWGRELFRGWVLLYIESFLLGGVFQFVQQYIRRGSMFFLLAVISYYLVSVIWKIILFFSEKGNRYCEVEVFFGEKNDRLRGLIDTGNTLSDTISNDPVSIIDRASVRRLTEEKKPERFQIYFLSFHREKRGL